ncbi:carbon-nitrogen hydrolase family protein [Aspergillus clavatus NRRL 1]|uniref:nitrilase n=1 Tax=Aspergillus clavatus (strain ATCC 1007 / CBS 513.65 / DSM 816 / NCTC 3887 / NRRL 1 / QM 1276 / 107) TaxID=344612 RepID=A1C880_ASPCL|nr:nitrilase, putative [Aspergillus clavatus NRRL 1]EAW14601.1 nitrilase, putative [Aspergillus clavatus NRRL 1]
MATPSPTVRVAVTQAEPAWLNLQEGVAKTCRLMAEAAQNGAQLIAFPECWIPGYPGWIWTRNLDPELNIRYLKNSLRLDGPEIDRIKSCARDNAIAVSLGFSEYDHGSLYIAQVLIAADGTVKAHRRKMKPTHMERTIFGDASGECFDTVVQLPFARVGNLSCWEHIQPLLKYHTYAQREQIHVSAWPPLYPHSGAEDLWSMSAEGCHALSRTYAIESQTFVLHCTAVLSESGIETLNTKSGMLMSIPGGGSSAIFGPDGRRLTPETESTVEAIVYADLDLDLILASRMFADPLGHYSRPDLMQLTVCKDRKQKVVQ